jgi:hypothetical protein
MRNLEMYFAPATASVVHMWSAGVEQELRAASDKVNHVKVAPDCLLSGGSAATTSTEGAAA